MTTVANAVRVPTQTRTEVLQREVRVSLLGLGQVGGAIAEIARQNGGPHRFTIGAALVRDVHRPRPIDTSSIELTTDPAAALAANPDVLVEVLGGLEPARTIVLAALASAVPVVTANKSLLAAHGDELFEAATHAGVPLLYEASVLAGVPFLGTFRWRPLARDTSGLRGIVNGTSNYILSRMAKDRVSFGEALAEAQRAGYAEPDPSKDIQGGDAVEKLCVLLRHFGGWSVQPDGIETTGIAGVEAHDLEHAGAFGGAVRPVVAAEWDHTEVLAYAGPAFVDNSTPLARVDGVQNAISLKTRWSTDLFFSGPGAGPIVTAATVLDDVFEAHHQLAQAPAANKVRACSGCGAPQTGWFLRLTGSLSDETEAPRLLAGLGVRMRRSSPIDTRTGAGRQWLLTASCTREHVVAALEVLAARTGCAVWSIRVAD